MWNSGKYTYKIKNTNDSSKSLDITVTANGENNAKAAVISLAGGAPNGPWDTWNMQLTKFEDASSNSSISYGLGNNNNVEMKLDMVNNKLMNIEVYLRYINDRGKKAIF